MSDGIVEELERLQEAYASAEEWIQAAVTHDQEQTQRIEEQARTIREQNNTLEELTQKLFQLESQPPSPKKDLVSSNDETANLRQQLNESIDELS